MTSASGQRAIVVTGAAVGIGAAIAEELGRLGAFVVTLDANVTVDGSAVAAMPERTTAERIVEAGGAARSVVCSVTDEKTVRAIFGEVVAEFGALDAVVNVAGISRPTGFATGSEDDWRDLLQVHLDGYLTVLRAALPLMAAAGHGRIVGVTSGSGWRAANAGAYSCAKRAVAALTWQIGKVTPAGVTVNALSPIAATRMVAAALARAGEATPPGATGGITLDSFPPPEHLGPVGAFLASEELGWCGGRIFFSAGAELALVSEPRVLEFVRSRPVADPAAVLAQVVPAAFVPAETDQSTGGGSAARFTETFDRPRRPEGDHRSGASDCVIVCDDARWRGALVTALGQRGVRCAVIAEPAGGFEAVARQFAAAGEGLGSPNVVVAIRGGALRAPGTSAEHWEQVLTDHAGLTDRIVGDAAWARAVAEAAASAGRAVRLVTLTPATSPSGRSRAQAVAQLSRASRSATNDLVSAFAVSCESDDEGDDGPMAELVGHLVAGADTEALSGAEFCVGRGWWGLRSHPTTSGTISFGGPSVPSWLNDAIRELVDGPNGPSQRGG